MTTSTPSTPLLHRVAPLLVRAVIAVGAVLGIGLDVIAGGGSVGWLVPVTSTIAALGMLFAGPRRPVGLGLAVAVGLGTTIISLMGIGGGTMPGFTEMGALMVLVAGTIRHAPTRVAVAGVVAALVDTALIGLVRMPLSTGVTNVIVLWFPLVLAAGAGAYVRFVDETAARAAQTARREERLVLARELHDTIAHHVTGMVVQAQAGQLVGEDRPELAVRALAAIEESGAATMSAMRRFVGALRSGEEAPVTPAAGLADVRALAEEVSAAGPRVVLAVRERDVPAELGPTVFRLVQEALTNVRRHAVGAEAVTVDIGAAHGGLVVAVRDDGAPVPPGPSGGGFGLAGLAERIQALGGWLAAGPAAGGGWRVAAWLPVGSR